MQLPQVADRGNIYSIHRDREGEVSDELERQREAVRAMGDAEHYRAVYAAEGVPCPVAGCVLSAQEHHRLAYGQIAELRELREFKRRIEAGVEPPALES